MNALPNPSPAPRGLRRLRQSLLGRTLAPVLVGLAFLVVLFGGLWLIAARVSKHSDEVDLRLGRDTFDVLVASRAADLIAEDGPLLYQDLLVGGDRDIYVSHVGDDDKAGWYAFEARVPGSDRSCTVRWDRARGVLVDPCTRTEYPASGDGLPQYPASVNLGGRVVVDLTPAGEPGGGTTTLP